MAKLNFLYSILQRDFSVQIEDIGKYKSVTINQFIYNRREVTAQDQS
jgi:hypothetical protein